MTDNLLLQTAEGTEHLLTRFGLYFLGRDRACDVAFPADTVLSARHAVIFNDGRCFFLLDYKSRNGLAVNGTQKRSHRLVDGDVVTMGGQTLRVTLGVDSRPSSPRLFERDESDPTVARLVQLNRVTCALMLETDMARLRPKILRMAVDIFRARRGLFVTAGTIPPFVLKAHVGFPADPDIFQPWCLEALVHGHETRTPLFAVLSAPAPDDPKVKKPPDSRLDYDAYAVVPIRLNQQSFGMLTLYRKPSDQPFSREDTNLMTPFIRYVALALRASERLTEQGLA